MVDEEINSHSTEHEERRQHNRSRLIIDVFFNGKDATGVASTKDISVGGLFMKTQSHLPVGASLLVRIPLHEREVVVNGDVIYVEEGIGVGVRFRDLSGEDRAALEREMERG